MKFYKVTILGESIVAEEALEYQIGKTTVPNYGKIFVFDSLENAKQFHGDVFEGTAINPKKLKIMAKSLWSEDHKIFWKEKQSKKKHTVSTDKAMQGTFVCDAFTPEKLLGKTWEVKE